MTPALVGPALFLGPLGFLLGALLVVLVGLLVARVVFGLAWRLVVVGAVAFGVLWLLGLVDAGSLPVG